MTSPHDETLKAFENHRHTVPTTVYDFTLFVNGASDLSARAIANARRMCDSYFAGRYQLAVVDVHEDPAAVLRSRVLAAPTLVRNTPLPMRRVVGDLSQVDRVLRVLEFTSPADVSKSAEKP
jgi:circadian clock protein KaiB